MPDADIDRLYDYCAVCLAEILKSVQSIAMVEVFRPFRKPRLDLAI
ncbi:hypothetical protein [Algirhabdus cladophorae]